MKSQIVKLSPKGWSSFKTLKVTDVTQNYMLYQSNRSGEQVLFFITLETEEF